MKFTIYLPILIGFLLFTGCEPSQQAIDKANQSNEWALKHPIIVGTTEDNILIKCYELKFADFGDTTKSRYIYVAIPQNTNALVTTTVNHEEKVGKQQVNQVEVIINGVHMIGVQAEKQ